MNRMENMTPGNDGEFDWDPAQETTTAWSTSNSRVNKGRRAYGRRASRKSTNPEQQRGDNNKRQSVQRSRTFEDRNISRLDEEDTSSHNNTEWGSALSNSSFDVTRSTEDAAPPQLPPPLPFVRHTRSTSFNPSLLQRPPLLQRQSYSTSSPVRSESTRGSMSSSTASSLATTDSRSEQIENAQPNLGTLELSFFPSPRPPTKVKKIDLTPLNIDSTGRSKRKKLSQLNHSETDLSDSSPASFVSPSSTSFSRLAKSTERAFAWIKPPDLCSPGLKETSGPFDFSCLTDANTSSPAKSVATTSSRKRGVCELPFDDEDEASVNAGNLLLSASSYGSRSRSRSRIFSTNSTVKVAGSFEMPDASESLGRGGTYSDNQDEERDEDSAAESDAFEDSSVDDAMDVEPDFRTSVLRTENISRLPPKPRRRSSEIFDDSVFGAKQKVDSTLVLDPSQIFETMSSYNDLKFLIKALRKEKVGSTFASFGTNRTWTIAPPPVWDSRRRAAFLQWASRGLGFSLRAGGGAISFLQTSVSKGGDILECLETALIAYKAEKDEFTANHSKPSASTNALGSSFPCRPSSLQSRSRMKAVGSSIQVDADIDRDLLSGIESLNVTDVTQARTGTDVPFVRSVTIDTISAPAPPTNKMVLLPFDGAESPQESHRLSGEHHVGGHDLVLHLHGLSPTPSRGPPPLPMNRVSRMSVSPFLQPLSVRHGGPRISNVPFDEDDCLDTPSVKRENQFWGSGSRGGRDWGVSTRCSDEVLIQLLGRLEDIFKSAGCPVGSPFDGLDDKMEDRSCTSVFLPSCVASAAVSSSVLGFDEEVEECEESDMTDAENEDTFDARPAFTHERRSSVGATALAELNLHDDSIEDAKLQRKRWRSFAKHKRVSLSFSVSAPVGSIANRRRTALADHAGARSSNTGFASLSTVAESRRSSLAQPFEHVICPIKTVCEDVNMLPIMFSFLSERELLCSASTISTTWADAATVAHANIMLISVGCSTALAGGEGYDSDDDSVQTDDTLVRSVSKSMERSWNFLTERFPWACYLSDGAFKRVYKVHNAASNSREAISVMDIAKLSHSGDKGAVGAELAVSAMLSSLARRKICPNFVLIRGVFTCPYEPPAAYWGSSEKKRPRGFSFDPSQPARKPRVPASNKRGKFQYIRMELCKYGDAEEHLKTLSNEVMPREEARAAVFQIAFALHVAADRFSLKHYDIKLLNIFLQDAIPGRSSRFQDETITLRYGLGEHVFALQLPAERALLAKIADYGTANVQSFSNGQPVTIGQFTTLENTPPEYLFRGDAATQGHGHDSFGLGLCMLHLFTGHRPYEEILEDVTCPPSFMKKLRQIWLEDEYAGYNVVRQVIFADVDEEAGEPDETLCHTLYRFLVLFGIPEDKGQFKEYPRVWKAVIQSLEGSDRARVYGRGTHRSEGPDSSQFTRDRRKYSLSHGNNKYIARARKSLEMMEGGMEILKSLVNFDPQKRATPLDVLNSSFMSALREGPGQAASGPNVLSFMSYATR